MKFTVPGIPQGLSFGGAGIEPFCRRLRNVRVPVLVAKPCAGTTLWPGIGIALPYRWTVPAGIHMLEQMGQQYNFQFQLSVMASPSYDLCFI